MKHMRLKIILLETVLLTLLFTLISCSTATPIPSPTLAVASSTPLPPPKITLAVSNGSSEVEVNKSVAVVANANDNQKLILQWSVTGNSGGKVNPITGENVVYTAGSKPGIDILVAEGTTASGARVKETVTLIILAGPTPTPVIPISRDIWPKSEQEAADLFAKGQGKWTQDKYGGWALAGLFPSIEVFVPAGIALEGYNDGANPPQTFKCYTVLGPARVIIQGGMFRYPDDPSDPVWTARKVNKERKDKNCTTIGFTLE